MEEIKIIKKIPLSFSQNKNIKQRIIYIYNLINTAILFCCALSSRKYIKIITVNVCITRSPITRRKNCN